MKKSPKIRFFEFFSPFCGFCPIMRHYAQKWPIMRAMRAKFGQIMRPVRIIMRKSPLWLTIHILPTCRNMPPVRHPKLSSLSTQNLRKIERKKENKSTDVRIPTGAHGVMGHGRVEALRSRGDWRACEQLAQQGHIP